ncbi:MAG: hypothetical protein EOP48_08115 [Sphingobacteriales bacterium]|nr:MAG: hypothetical protein EOP48_08115 [Sphingobacteriales bacterium]
MFGDLFMYFSQLILLGSVVFVSLKANSQDINPEVTKNANGTFSVTYSLPKGSTEGVYLANRSNVLVIKPSAALSALGLEVNDRILSACGKDLSDSKLTIKEKIEIVRLRTAEICIIKYSKKDSINYVTYRKISKP